MTVFAYTGVDNRGKTVRGTIDTDTVKSARQLLRKKGVFLDDAKPLRNATAARGTAAVASTAKGGAPPQGFAIAAPSLARLLGFFRRLVSNTSRDVSLATRQLATLLKAGIPLSESLEALLDQLEEPDLRAAFQGVKDRVREGIAFAKALEEHPRYFAPLFVNMVAAGEASGTLDAVLERLADFTESQVKLRGKIVSALAYPAFMMFFGSVIVTILMVVVVPKVTSIFDDFHRALPWYTQLLITVSRFVGNFWWLIALTIVVAAETFRRWQRTPEGAYKWDNFVLRLPIAGELARMVAISRFTRTLSTLLAAGVPLLRAMDIVKNILGNRVLEAVVTEATTSIKEGESIAEPLKRSGRFPPMVTHMIAVGERSGDLEGMLENVARAYDTTIDARVTVMTSLLEPLMIVLMGGSAGLIAFSILMPLVQLNEFAQ